MIRNSLIIVLLAGLAAIFYGLFSNYHGTEKPNQLASYYTAEENINAVNSANLVTAVVVTYRGFDTLGEVTILFITASIVGFFMKGKVKPKEQRAVRETSEILATATKVLVPVFIMFGIYIMINGHLTPGGGFQGGAVIASSVVLLLLSNPNMKINRTLFTVLESISGVGFVVVGIIGIILAGGFLDNRIMEMGKLGSLLSAGAIPIIYSFIGLKVGSELSNLLGDFNEVQNEI
ncbi:MAG TPA: hydrogen gas-evolving membrane-bound hydrogenase subunit E [Williamwhitmania sp.]|nr:hydrogen gas-evolving membrane-bound hydrogenase subunit E [Williamwhitmania sp.]